jgi:heavy metal translocating P-type ATPase
LVPSATTERPAAPGTPAPPRRTRLFAVPETRWAGLATALFLAGGLAQLTGAPPWLYWTLYFGCYAAGGWEPARSGIEALRQRTLDVDLLMIVAAIGAAAIGQIFDGALLIVIFATSGALEALATRRTADSVRGLLDLAPDRAARLGDGGDEETVPTTELVVGDEILVRPGERIGADGEVLDGAGEVDQASITGEALPVPKSAGEQVFAGTRNGTGALRVRVGRAAGETVVARIVAMVGEASATKARTQLFVEKIEQRYSVGVVVATLALFAVPLAFGAALQPSLLRAMTFMIVASPCAVVLATMPPLLSAIANAGRHGVLVKSAVVLERLGATTKVAFDKTGTLTEGVPRVGKIVARQGFSEDEVLRLAASAEYPSEHPLAGAVVAAARDRGLALSAAREFAADPGRGVTALVDGRRISVGSPEYLLAGTETVAMAEEYPTVVVMLADGENTGLLGLTDRLRPGARETVAGITALTGAEPVLLTGDNAHAAGRLARAAGITDVRAGLLPEDKVEAIRALESGGDRVLVAGEGVNDAPALAAAHTGVAMGGTGSDLTLDTADAIVVRDELATIPAVVALARRARRFVVANLVIAAAFIAVLVLWDLFGTLPLPLGVAGHEGSTVVVGLNGLRLLRERAWRG